MKIKFLTAILAAIFVAGGAANAQPGPQPQQEQLLNGLKVMVLKDISSPKVMIKVRIHSGASFDPKDKMGVMALLADIIFPDPQTREYFTEDLEGSLDVVTTYDYIQITATGKADELVSMLDTIRIGLVNTPINQENFVKVRDARLAKAKEEWTKQSTIADDIVARRLLGDYPYGRAMSGTPESLAKIDRFDLVSAKERFLDADNATMVIIGNVDPRFALKAAKQLLGSWNKSDGVAPSTFAAPLAPNESIGLVDSPGATVSQVRLAVRGLSLNDKDAPALSFWTMAAEKRLMAEMAECSPAKETPDSNVSGRDWLRPFRVVSKTHLLPGYVVINAIFLTENTGKCFNLLKTAVGKITTEKINAQDFTSFQNGVYNMVSGGLDNNNHLSDLWLNTQTFKWGKLADQLNLLKSATPDAGDKAAQRVFKGAPVVTVIVGDAAKIKAQLEPASTPTVPATPAATPAAETKP